MAKIDPSKLTVDFKSLMRLSMSDRYAMAQSSQGRSYLASLTPTEFALLFPDYYRKRLPDMGISGGGRGKTGAPAISTATPSAPSTYTPPPTTAAPSSAGVVTTKPTTTTTTSSSSETKFAWENRLAELAKKKQIPSNIPNTSEKSSAYTGSLKDINKHQLAFLRGLGMTESGFRKAEAYSERYNQAGNNANVRKYGSAGADYGFYQTNELDVKDAIRRGVDPEIARHLHGGGRGGTSTIEQQTLAMHEYLKRKYSSTYEKLKEGSPESYENARRALSRQWFGLKDNPGVARKEFQKGLSENSNIFTIYPEINVESAKSTNVVMEASTSKPGSPYQTGATNIVGLKSKEQFDYEGFYKQVGTFREGGGRYGNLNISAGSKTEFGGRGAGAYGGLCGVGVSNAVGVLFGKKEFKKVYGMHAGSFSMAGGNDTFQKTGLYQSKRGLSDEEFNTIRAAGNNHGYPPGTIIAVGSTKGSQHIQIWDGRRWISDTVQKNLLGLRRGESGTAAIHIPNAQGINSLPSPIRNNISSETLKKYVGMELKDVSTEHRTEQDNRESFNTHDHQTKYSEVGNDRLKNFPDVFRNEIESLPEDDKKRVLEQLGSLSQEDYKTFSEEISSLSTSKQKIQAEAISTSNVAPGNIPTIEYSGEKSKQEQNFERNDKVFNINSATSFINSRNPVGAKLKQVDPTLMHVTAEGIRNFENKHGGRYSVRLLGPGGGKREGSSSYHAHGTALDYVIIDNRTGKSLTNFPGYDKRYGFQGTVGETAPIYQDLANSTKIAAHKFYPEKASTLRWGGYGKWGENAMDTMHFDWDSRGRGLGYGTFEKGFSKEAMVRYGIYKNIPIEDITKAIEMQYPTKPVAPQTISETPINDVSQTTRPNVSVGSSQIQGLMPNQTTYNLVGPAKNLSNEDVKKYLPAGATFNPETRQVTINGDLNKQLESIPERQREVVKSSLDPVPAKYAGGEIQTRGDTAMVVNSKGEPLARINPDKERISLTESGNINVQPEYRTDPKTLEQQNVERRQMADINIDDKLQEMSAKIMSQVSQMIPPPQPNNPNWSGMMVDTVNPASFQNESFRRAMAGTRFEKTGDVALGGHFEIANSNLS